MAIHVHALGGLRIVQDGTEVEALPGQPLRCALLLHVAVEGRATRESVMGVLWPGRDPERARHSLSQTLYELRRELGEACIETAGEVLRSGPELSVDVTTFGEAVEGGERARALEAYRGRFLQGVHVAPTREFESWADRVRSRLHRLHRKIRSEHITACIEEGRRDEALTSARRWAELDALDDEAQHHLIRLLAESGRRSEALLQYQRYRELLARELELEPLDEIQELVRDIRDGSVGTGPVGTAPGGPSAAEDRKGRKAAAPAERGAPGADPASPRSGGLDVRTGSASPAADADESFGLRAAVDEARLPRILAFYLVASFAVLQAVDILIDRIRLPETFFAAALVLVIAGLPVVVTTALIQAGALQRLGGASGALPRRWLRTGARWFTWRNAALAALAGAAAWTAYAFLFTPDEPVASEAEVIAVLPFTVSGAGVQDFGKGIVSLLGPNLDGVGGIRTVNSRTVIHRWEEGGGRVEPDFEEALAIGREVGAASVVLGSVVSLGDRVRLLAELHSVDGETLARADAEGPLSEVLSLVDSLTVHLVRNVWRSQEPIPDLRVSAITTGSLPAMRAFFQGEEMYRRSRWDSAAVAFRRAVELDSTFALAHFRFADSEIWSARSYTPAALRAMEAAYRRRDRLPPRERTLVTARQLDLDGELAAVDTMAAFVDRYPQDAEGWYFLGDVRFHAQRLLALPPAALYRPFERALELLPTFSPALIHPLEWTLVNGDSLRFHRYLDRFRSLSGESDPQLYSVWSRVRWGPPDSSAAYLDRSLREHGMLASQPLLVAATFHPKVDPERVLQTLDRHAGRLDREELEWRSTRSLRLMLLAGLGRLSVLREELDEVWRTSPDLAVQLELNPVLGGLAPPGFARRAVAYLEERAPQPASAYWRALRDVHAGAAERARGRIREVSARSDSLDALLTAAEGWAAIAAGDTVSGLRLLREGLQAHGYANPPRPVALRHAWAVTLASRPDDRAEGIRRLRFGITGDELLVPNRLALARALEKADEPERARAAYDDVLRLLEGADSAVAGLRDEARRGLERLTSP